MNASTGRGPPGKVARLLEEYEIEEFGDKLVDWWTADGAGERLGLRALARQFNIRLLEERLVAANETPIEGTVENYYDSLISDDVSSGVKTQVRRSLEQAGIDVVDLQDDFVSRQAIHTYLRKTRDVNHLSEPSSISVTSIRETIDRLRERVRLVTASRLKRLHRAGELTLGGFRVLVDVQVYCEECGTQKNLAALLEEGSCECET